MVEPAGNISSVLGVVLQVGKWLAAPIGRRFMYLYNYNTNFDNLREDVDRLKDAKGRVERKIVDAERNVEEIEVNVKMWQNNVEKAIFQAERLIQDKSKNPRCLKGLCPNLKTRYRHSKEAFKLKRDDIGPLLLQEEKFGEVSYPTIPPDRNFDKLQDDVSKLKNARLKVQRKVDEAKNNEEEIEEDVKKWLKDVDSIIVKAEELIENQSSIGTDRKTGYQNSKAASELMDVIGPLLRQEERFDKVSYSTIQLSNYEKNFDKLRADVLKLKNSRFKVQRKVDEAKNNLEEIEKDVKKWVEDVDSIIVKAEDLIENQSSIGTDRKTRYQNSKAAAELMVENIGPLLQQEERFDKVSHPTVLKDIWLRPSEDYLAFESRNSTMNKVWDALKDEHIYMIGVYGMGGLGKTTLLQEVGRQAEKDKLFEEIVFVEITETPDINKIQTTIGNKLGLKLEGESEKANKLYLRMEKKNILLIVDNIWEKLELEMVGIPSEADRGRNKILMTTRNVDVLDKMGSTNNFEMGILNEEEAWSLFKKMAGNVIQTPKLNSLPNEVCKECGGLPIVICTIAKALRNKRQEFQWKDALRELSTPSTTKFTRLLEKEYSKIKLSYDYLEDDEFKKTFIISSLLENDTSISDLLKNIFSLGILTGVNLTIEQARDRLDVVVKELKDSCLLLDGTIKGRFSMHDIVRVVALTCGYTYHHVFTGKNDIESEWKDKDQLRKCTIISLVDNDIITQLWPEGLDFPELEFFDMSKGFFYSEFPDKFFTVMPKLKVLNLFEIEERLLPSSLDLLTNLQSLCLDNSYIKDVAIIGKLKKLKVFSLRNCFNIKVLTTEIGQLTQLRLLDLSYCQELEVIAPNVISKLSQLEELYIRGCSIKWKAEELEELKGLSHLTSLELDIKDNKMLPRGFFSKELRRYNISIGDWEDEYPEIRDDESFTRLLLFTFNSAISLEELQGIKNVEILLLVADVENSLDELQSNITPLFNEKLIFTNLMILELHNISSGKIWDNQLSTHMSSSYKNLTQLILHNCGNIKYAFLSSIAKNLALLQQLKINDCMVLEEIVAKEEGANAIVNFVFPNVTLLELENLPELTAFYPEKHTSEWPKLKMLLVRACDKFTSKDMSFQENNKKGELHISEPISILLGDKINSDLEEMDLWYENIWITWNSRSNTLSIWFDKSANIPLELLQRFENLKQLHLYWNRYKELFLPNLPNLEVLKVSNCNRLMKLITPSKDRSLVQLREINVESCEKLIEIVENEGDATMAIEIVFNNLKKLSLKKLKNLTCFCSGNSSFSFPSLEELIMGECPNIKTFSQGILSTPKLHKVIYERLVDGWKWDKIMEVENEGNDLNKTIQQNLSKTKNRL